MQQPGDSGQQSIKIRAGKRPGYVWIKTLKTLYGLYKYPPLPAGSIIENPRLHAEAAVEAGWATYDLKAKIDVRKQ